MHCAIFPTSTKFRSINECQFSFSFWNEINLINLTFVLTTVFVWNVSLARSKILNVNFYNIWIFFKDQSSFLRFWISPCPFKSELFHIVFFFFFSIGLSVMEITFVLLIFVQKVHLAMTLWNRISKIAMIEQMIRNIQSSGSISWSIFPLTDKKLVLRFVFENRQLIWY